ncbi:MAG: DUF1254 domain-containing protein [Gemmatimonadetes bacterium]|nr:DUF1254 domain-containing protein [Gemmatimonadota bacterium]
MSFPDARTFLGAAVLLTLAACAPADDASLTESEAQSIAKEAWIYGFPMVVNYKTLNMYVVDESSPEYKGPLNYLWCEARVFTPEDKAVVTPNADTPYCMFWGDLRAEPLVLTVPEMEADRFYQFQLIDLYTHNFAYVSTVATGNVAGSYLIAGPEWEGDTPDGMNAVISSETPIFFVVVRTQLFGPDDLDRVGEIQDGYSFQPLSSFLGTEAPPAAPAIDFPEWIEGSQPDARSLDYIDFMTTLVEPVPEEQALFERFAEIDLGTDGTFDLEAISPEIQAAIADGVQEGFADLEAFVAEQSADPRMSGKIFGTRAFLRESARENYDTSDYYMLRTAAAHTGLYGNSAVEAMYPVYFVDSNGQPLDGAASAYTVTFEAGELPPVNAFWSLTMYDGATQLFIENTLDRYLLNSTMMEQLRFEDDGSLVLHVQKESPGAEREANWLPAPDGPFYMVMRLYGPQEAALQGEWTAPPAVKVEGN